MGSTGMHAEPGRSTDAIMREEHGGQIVASATVSAAGGEYPTVWYAAERRDDGRIGAVLALVRRGGGGYFNVTYKWVSEEMGPGDYDCPAAILAILSPTDNPYALAWRERCRANLASPRVKRAKAGDVIRFERPIAFSNGASGDTFRYTGKASTFEMVDAGSQLYRIGGWQRMPAQIVGA